MSVLISRHRYRGVPEEWNDYTVPDPIELMAVEGAMEEQVEI